MPNNKKPLSPQPEPFPPRNTHNNHKKPWYKKWWVWVIIAVLAISIIGGLSGQFDDPQYEHEQAIEQKKSQKSLNEWWSKVKADHDRRKKQRAKEQAEEKHEKEEQEQKQKPKPKHPKHEKQKKEKQKKKQKKHKKTDKNAIPNVVGMQYDKAKPAVKRGHWTWRVEGIDLEGNEADRGVVVKQTPKAGSHGRLFQKITLTIKTWNDQNREYQKLKGTDAAKAINRLKRDKKLGSVTNAKDRSHTDLTNEVLVQSKSGNKWVVTHVEYLINGKKVNIEVETKSNIDAEKRQKRIKENLEKKLDDEIAYEACDQHGRDVYPYGFKIHRIMGTIQDFTPKNANTWYYKARVTVTNVFGADRDATMECEVTGTTDNPHVSRFDVY
jgi:hypothetical protein